MRRPKDLNTLKAGNHRPTSETPNCVSLAGRRYPNNECWLGCCVPWDPYKYCQETLYFCDYQGRGGGGPDHLSPHWIHACDKRAVDFETWPTYVLLRNKPSFGKYNVSKGAKIRNRYNQVPHLTRDTNGNVTNSQLGTTNESQEVSPFPAGDHNAHINRRAQRQT